MLYELWDYDAANIVWSYHSEAEALAEVAAQIEAFGREAVGYWVLLSNDRSGTEEGIQRIAYGQELADLALGARVSAAD